MWLFSGSGCLLSRNECWFWLFSKLVCVNQMKRRDIFIIRDVEWRSTFFSSVKFVVCCKNFVDFQIDLYVKTNSFPLKSVVCNYNWARAEADDHVDFHYCNIFVENYDNADDDSDFNNSSSDNDADCRQTNCFVSSLCFCGMRTCLKFTRFCLKCRDTFFEIFYAKNAFTWEKYFFSLIEKMSKTTQVCDCFLDFAIYYLFSIEDLCYADFFDLCLEAKKSKKEFVYDLSFLEHER